MLEETKRMNTKLTDIDRELIDYAIERRFNATSEDRKQRCIKDLEGLINDCYNDYFNKDI